MSQLIAREDFTAFSRHANFTTYIVVQEQLFEITVHSRELADWPVVSDTDMKEKITL
jgi:hypothetical protein